MSAEVLQGLDKSIAGLLRAKLEHSDAAKETWNSFHKGLKQGQSSQLKEEVQEFLDNVEEKQELLAWMAKFPSVSKLHRSQVAGALTVLLAQQSWMAVVASDTALAAELRQVDTSVVDALQDLPSAEAPAAAPSDAAFAAPQPSPHGSTAPDRLQSGISAAEMAAVEAREREAERRADEETCQLTRQAFQDIEALDYEVTDKNSQAAIAALTKLMRAVNRLHFAYERRRGHMAATIGTSDGSEEAPAHGVKTMSYNAEADLISESMREGNRVPVKVLMFLHDLKKKKQLYKGRCESTAHKLLQLSEVFSDALRSDAFLTSWLSASGVRLNGRSTTVSFPLVNSIRWATWDLAWYHVHKQRQYEDQAAQAKNSFEKAEAVVLSSMELPRSVLDLLLKAAKEACTHTAEVRFPAPGKERGMLGNVMGHKDAFMKKFDEVKKNDQIAPKLVDNLLWMIWNLAWYAPNAAKGMGHGADATQSLIRAERHLSVCHRGAVKWRGVNLGGWFLLEPGPCCQFWRDLPKAARSECCEWGCLKALGPEEAKRRLAAHRRTYYTSEDFQRMRKEGLTHVRLPIAAWNVIGPRPDEPFVGPCLEDLDRALDNIEAAGLMVVLDLHGHTGGISNNPPAGFKNPNWRQSDWDIDTNLEVLRILAERYAERHCVPSKSRMNPRLACLHPG